MEKQIFEVLSENQTFAIMERFRYTIYELNNDTNSLHKIIFNI